jgi:membrane fusion protein, multidrug efflux system
VTKSCVHRQNRCVHRKNFSKDFILLYACGEMKKEMTMKTKFWSLISTAAILGASLLVFVLFSGMRKAPERKNQEATRQLVPVEQSSNEHFSVEIPVSGRAEALQKVEIYAEVSGILESRSPLFVEGMTFLQGDTLLQINRDEFDASLKSAKIAFYTQLAKLLPELKYAYPENYAAWKGYFDGFNADGAVRDLPEAKSDQERIFVTVQGIYQSFYNIRSQESRQAKYVILAPFAGVVSESVIKPGTLVRSGQKLGIVIEPHHFEMAVALTEAEAALIQPGDEVKIRRNGEIVSGKIARISPRISGNSQSISAFVQLSSNSVRDGEYLSGSIAAQANLYGQRIPNRYLTLQNSVYLLENGQIVEKAVHILQQNGEYSIVAGLNDNAKIVTRTQGLYRGMPATDQNTEKH